MTQPILPGRQGRLCVIGPLRIDHLTRLETLPAPGQTVSASDLVLRRTGKGADQAIAAARRGARVSFVGAVGEDAHGDSFREHLRSEGIAIQHLSPVPGPTGAAFIQGLPSGDQSTVVFPGANHGLTPEHIQAASGAIAESALLLIQLDIPIATAVTAIQIANRADTRVMFNPSPFSPEFPWSEVFIDILILHEPEAEQLDATVPSGMDLPVDCLIITRDNGTVEVIAPDGDFHLAPPTVETITVDTFAGTLAAGLALGRPLREAVALPHSPPAA